MIRNLKALVLALAVAAALSAVAASAASAQGTFTADGPFTLTATETGAGLNAFTAFGVTVECPGSTYTGHAYNVTPHALMPSGTSTSTLVPKYASCKTKAGQPATVDLNGCDYVIHLGATKDKEGTYLLTFDIVCPAGQELTVTFFTNSMEHINNKPYCVWHFKPQTGLKGLHATDTKNGHVDISGTLENVHITRVSPSPPHIFVCPSETVGNAKIDIDVTVKGLSGGGGPTQISLSD